VLVEKLGHRTVELGQAGMNLDHLVRGDRVGWVDVRFVLCPFVAAVTAVEQEAVAAGPIDVDGSGGWLASAGAPAIV